MIYVLKILKSQLQQKEIFPKESVVGILHSLFYTDNKTTISGYLKINKVPNKNPTLFYPGLDSCDFDIYMILVYRNLKFSISYFGILMILDSGFWILGFVMNREILCNLKYILSTNLLILQFQSFVINYFAVNKFSFIL